MREGSEPECEAGDSQYSKSSAGALVLLPPLSPSLSKSLVIELEQAEPSRSSITRIRQQHHSLDGFEGRSDQEERRLDMVNEVDRMSISMLSMSHTSPVVAIRDLQQDSNNISMVEDNNNINHSTRPRSSSNSSDRTQRTLRRTSYTIASTTSTSFPSTSSSSSSSSSINSGNLTPLASPSYSNIQSHNSLDSISTSTLNNSQTSTTSTTTTNLAAPLSDHTATTTSIARRHYRQNQNQIEEGGDRGEAEVDCSTTLGAGWQQSHKEQDRKHRTASSIASHAPSTPPQLSINTLGLTSSSSSTLSHLSPDQPTAGGSLQYSGNTGTTNQQQQDRSYSLVAVTSSSPIRKQSSLRRSDLSFSLGQGDPASLTAAENTFERSSTTNHHTGSTLQTFESPSSSLGRSSQSFLIQGESCQFRNRNSSSTALTEGALPIPPHSPSSSSPPSSLFTRPLHPYRIPSFNTSADALIAALPDSLSQLQIIHGHNSGTGGVARQDHQLSSVQEYSPCEDIAASPVDIDSSYPSPSATSDVQPQFTSPPHQQHNISTSLPASPSRVSHNSTTLLPDNGAFSLRIPSLLHTSIDNYPSSPISRLPLTPLEEINSPDMHLDSPADLAEACNPFEAQVFADHLHKSSASTLQGVVTPAAGSDSNEIFYHTLLELVTSEAGYTADLTDLVEIHFSLLSFARFITEEQRQIIIRDAACLVDIHRRLQDKLRRVDEDLGWIREDESSDSSPSPSDIEDVDSPTTTAAPTPSPTTSSLSSPSSPVRQYFTQGHLRRNSMPHPSTSSSSASTPTMTTTKTTTTRTRRFQSSDATVLDAARRITSIFLNEFENLSEVYRPFCSGHSEAMEVVKLLASSSSKPEWDAFEAQCTSHLASRRRKKSSSTRLHFADFLIKPVQRICRYPLLIGNLLKNAQKTSLARAGIQQDEHATQIEAYLNAGACRTPYSDVGISIDKIRDALGAAKRVASEVDLAQKQRSLEIATVKLARRIEVQSTEHVKLLNRLNHVILVGSAHVIYTHAPTVVSQGLPSVLKAGFYGLVLYDSHLILFKVKKTNVYEPRHWLPLRLFELVKVADGEGILPYAFRMSCGDHTFEIGSLCHGEQELWVQAIEEAAADSRKRWLEVTAHNPVAADENLICSVPLEPVSGALEGISPVMSNSEFGVFPTSSDLTMPPATLRSMTSFSGSSSLDTDATSAPRPRLSLKPPAQRVGVDLRLADLLSESILSARAQSKRSHALPLHGPPPRSMTSSTVLHHSLSKRPHSFHPAGFNYRNIIDSTLSSRRTSLAESDNSRSSSNNNTKQALTTLATSANITSMNKMQQQQSDTGDDALRRKPTKLRRSRTSSQFSSDHETTDSTCKPQRRSSTLGKIRRRASSFAADSAPMKALEELRAQEQLEQLKQQQQQQLTIVKPVVLVNNMTGQVAIVAEPAILNEDAQASVARNSSTSSSSSYASNFTDPSLNTSVETPQSSLPASPLLTPVDLETQSRWTKIGDALSHTLLRKRSFASSRPILAVPPETLLEGIQLEQAQHAAEYIYTGRDACSSSCSHSGTPSAATSAHSIERRYSWDRVGWTTLTAPASGSGVSSSRSSYGGHHRTASGVSAPPSMVGVPNISGGRSAPNLSSMVDKRQMSTNSLWSVFNRNGGAAGAGGDYSTTYTSSPAPSIYEDAQAEDDSSAFPSPVGGQLVPLPEVAEGGGRNIVENGSSIDEHGHNSAIPMTRAYPLSRTVSPAQVEAGLPAVTSIVPAVTASTSTKSYANTTSLSPPSPAVRSGSLIKRKNSLTARLRAFKALGSGMTPVRQQQPSRSYISSSSSA